MEINDYPGKLKDIEYTNDLPTTEAFVFFIEGFETSSTTSNTFCKFVLNPTIQNKLREKIREK